MRTATLVLLAALSVHSPNPLLARDPDSLAPRAVALLKKHCWGCHGEGKDLDGALDLRTRQTLLLGGERGAAIIVGQPEKSLLWRAIRWEGDVRMPPKEANRLRADEVELLTRWIRAGAEWAAPGGVESNEVEGVMVRSTPGLSADWSTRKYPADEVWAYRAPMRPTIPSGSAHPVDAFLDQSLAAHGLRPAPPADRRTLARRLSLDLTGLPPSPEDLDAFADDTAPDAFHRYVERLLNSPHYGEQQARHWLDVVRYADTSGFSNDYERPNAWRYRDYVVRGFQDDKPFDRLALEQLAGDELDEHDPELLIAVGFLRMGPWEHTAMSVAAETRQQFLDDVTNSVGVTFLGQALRCAGCHDHKFDPVPTRDYYRIQAAFAPVQFADQTVPFLPRERTGGYSVDIDRLRRLLREAESQRAAIQEKSRTALAAHLAERGVQKISELPAAEQSSVRFFGLTEHDKSTDKMLQKRIDYLQRELLRYEPLALSVYSGPPHPYLSNKLRNEIPPPGRRAGEVPPVRILMGGSLAAPADVVTPGVLSAVAESNSLEHPTPWNSLPETTQGRRLALARWIASSRNTLTARVYVNRVWQQHFHHGIVATPNNFGTKGARPTHPELLDWLTHWFIDHGWSTKALHRLIVTSAAYQRSSDHADADRVRGVDAKNQWLAFFPTRRLAAEEIRDGMLATTGELNRSLGGPPAFPEIHWEVALQPRQIMGSVAPAYQPSPRPADRHRRTLYALRIRTLADPLLEVFNRPGPDISCEQRDATTVTPQAFALLNGQASQDRSIALALRIERERATTETRVEQAWRSIYGRPPTDRESKLATAHLARLTAHHESHPPTPQRLPDKVARAMIEELTGELFTWDEPLDRVPEFQADAKPWDVGPATRALADLCLVLWNSNEYLYVR